MQQQSTQVPPQAAQYGLPMVNNAPMPVMLSTQQPRTRVKENYHAKCVKGLSITQIVLGTLAIILQIWDITIDSEVGPVGAGIWTGIFFIIAGSLGVVSSNTRTTCAIVSFLVMSIIASVLTVGLLTPSAGSISIGVNDRDRSTNQYNNYQYYGNYRSINPTHTNMTIAIGALLVIISLTEAIVAIVSSCYACHVLCCTDVQRGTVLIQGQVQYIQGPNGQAQMVIIPMPNQANVIMANPPYQYSTPVGGFQAQPLSVQAGATPQLRGHGMPPTPAQVLNVLPATPAQAPTYSRQGTPPPQYEPEGKQGERME